MSTLEREHESPEKTKPSNGDGSANFDEHAIPADLPKVRTWAVAVAAIILIAAFAGLFLLGWIPRQKRLAEVKQQSQELNDFRPQVRVTKPSRAAHVVDVVLPADTSAWQQTAIYPQANGYLSKQFVDIGQSVKAGQLLAVISMPEVDAQIIQAKADVSQAQANFKRTQDNNALAQTTLKRYTGFFKTGGITQQQLDQYRTAATQATADLAGAQASLQAAKANVQRLAALQAYENVTAPFAGTITARNYDLGALMSASNTSPGKELFDLANTSTLRVFVDVDQSYVTSAKVGDAAAIEVRNYPGRQFAGTIARTAGALNPQTRKMRYEIDVPNKNNLLYPGMYAEAILKIKQSHPSILIPTGALIFDAAGTRVWTVDGNIIQEKKVTVGRDFGTDMEITSGLTGAEQIVTNPGGQLIDGEKVDVLPEPATTQP